MVGEAELTEVLRRNEDTVQSLCLIVSEKIPRRNDDGQTSWHALLGDKLSPSISRNVYSLSKGDSE